MLGLTFFCVTAESSAFSSSKNTCHLGQPKPKAIPARETKPTLKNAPKTLSESESEQFVISEKNCSTDKQKHYVAAAFTVVSALMSYKAAKSYNDLSSKNRSLANQYKNSSKSSEKASYKSEYDSNSSKMETHKSRIQTWDLLTLAGLVWTVYLLMKDDSEETVTNLGNSFSPLIPKFVIKNEASGPKNFLLWKWHF
mgnify:CR=1 FL=1